MKKYEIGYTTGVYDMFHIGHLNILRRAKEVCDFLIVGVSTDELVEIRKHKRPIISFEERSAIVAAIRYVDKVIPQKDMNKGEIVKQLKADVVFVGSDWKGSKEWIQYEQEFSLLGCSVVYFPHTDGISSSILAQKVDEVAKEKE